jgi:hypothetical protein
MFYTFVKLSNSITVSKKFASFTSLAFLTTHLLMNYPISEGELPNDIDQLKLMVIDLTRRLTNAQYVIESERTIKENLYEELQYYKSENQYINRIFNLEFSRIKDLEMKRLQEKEYEKYEKMKISNTENIEKLRLAELDNAILNRKQYVPKKILNLKSKVIETEKQQESCKQFLSFLSSLQAINEQLVIAIQQGKSLEEINGLISQGANINYIDNIGYLPIHYATINGNYEVVEFLLSKGADYSTYLTGNSALILACQYGHLSILSLLLSYGGNINEKDQNGLSPILVALMNYHFSIVEYCLSNDANIEDYDLSTENTLLHVLVLISSENYLTKYHESGGNSNIACAGILVPTLPITVDPTMLYQTKEQNEPQKVYQTITDIINQPLLPLLSASSNAKALSTLRTVQQKQQQRRSSTSFLPSQTFNATATATARNLNVNINEMIISQMLHMLIENGCDIMKKNKQDMNLLQYALFLQNRLCVDLLKPYYDQLKQNTLVPPSSSSSTSLSVTGGDERANRSLEGGSGLLTDEKSGSAHEKKQSMNRNRKNTNNSGGNNSNDRSLSHHSDGGSFVRQTAETKKFSASRNSLIQNMNRTTIKPLQKFAVSSKPSSLQSNENALQLTGHVNEDNNRNSQLPPLSAASKSYSKMDLLEIINENWTFQEPSLTFNNQHSLAKGSGNMLEEKSSVIEMVKPSALALQQFSDSISASSSVTFD